MPLKLLQTLRDDFGFPGDFRSQRIRIDQLQTRLKLYPTMIGGQLVLIVLYCWMMWDAVSHFDLLLWAGGAYVWYAAEILLWRSYRGRVGTAQGSLHWHYLFIAGTAVGGLLWGALALWCFPADMEHQLLLIFVIMALVAAGVSTNAIYPSTFYIYALCVSLPLILRLVLMGDSMHMELAVVSFLYLLVVLKAGGEMSQSLLISLRRRYENLALLEQVTLEKSRAEAASREKSQFLAAASHDLRQPLQSLMLFSDAMQGVVHEKEAQHLASQIDKSVNALVEMFNELLDVSRLDAGVVEVRWHNFDIQPLLDRLYVELAPLAQSKGLLINMPNSDGIVYSDPVLLDRILRNLISNAIRYTDRGEVLIRCTPGVDGFRFSVIDTGIGISSEALPHIFDEYYQASNQHRDRRKGLGLGLAIVRRMENLLGYRVEVKSEHGKGSEFSFSVPRGKAEQHLTQPFVSTHSRHDLRGVTVALVEDDSDIRQMLKGLMGEWGCRVFAGEQADDVIRGLDAARQRPDLLVCDYRLPQGVTAVQVIERMHALWGDGVLCVVLTGDTAAETLQHIHASGALLLHKPITPTRLRTMMYFALHGES